MTDETNQPRPLPVLSAEQYEQSQAMDWVAPEDESRVRTFLFKFLPLFIICLFAYWSAWTGDFVWQDDVHVTDNTPLRSPSGLGLIWRAPTVTPEWSPMGYTLLWPQHLLWSDKMPKGYHLISLFVHTLNAMLVWMLLKRLEVPWPFVAAVIFALHPLQIEAVSWIARQPMLFGMMWGLCFMIVYLRWSGADPTVPNPSRIFRLPEGPKKLYALAILTLLLAVFAAPLAVCMLPVAMLIIVWWKRDGLTQKDVFGALPFILIGLSGLVFNALVSGRKNPAQHWDLNAVQSILVLPRGVAFYIQKFFWPSHLTVIHEKWTISPRDVLSWLMIIGAIVVTVSLWIRRREVGRLPFAGVSIFLLLLLPSLTPFNLMAMQTAYVAERFAYLAVAVLASAVVGAIASIGGPIVRDERWPGFVTVGVLTCVLASAVFMGHTTSFASSVALWENTANQNDENSAALINLALEYEKQKTGLPQAMDLYQRVLRLTGRRNVDALVNLGKIYEKQGKPEDIDEAMRYYQEAMDTAPDRPESYRQIGQVMVKRNKPEEAIAFYQNALKRFPGDAELHRLIGHTFAAQNQTDEAIDSFKKSIAINPYDANTHVELGMALFAKKNPGAFAEIELAQSLDPRNYQMYMSVGEMFVRLQMWDRAYGCYRNASYLKPEEPEPCNNVGLVATVQGMTFYKKGQVGPGKDKLKEAIVYLKRALQLKPDYESAIKNLKTAETLLGQMQKGLGRTGATHPATKPAAPK